MSTIPHGWTARRPTAADAEAVHALAIACDIAIAGEPDTDLEDILQAWSQIDLAQDAWLVFAPDARLAGYALVSGGEELFCDLLVQPEQRGDWLPALLIDLCQGRARERLAQAGATAISALRTIVAPAETATRRALEATGFGVRKYHFRMQIEMDAPPPEPGWPEGCAIRNIRPQEEDSRVYQFIKVAFAGSSGRWPAFEDWRAFTMRPDHFDPGLWFLLEHEGELIGTAACYDYTPMGWVRHLAVAEEWRRQGIGAALLQFVFGEFYRRGLPRVALGVHSENPQALQLYRKVGMTLVLQFDEYEKAL